MISIRIHHDQESFETLNQHHDQDLSPRSPSSLTGSKLKSREGWHSSTLKLLYSEKHWSTWYILCTSTLVNIFIYIYVHIWAKPINNEKWFLKSYNIYNIHTSEFHIALYNLLSNSIYVGKKSRSLSKFTSTSPPAQFLTMSHSLPLEANLGQFHPLIRDFSLAELSSSFSGVRSRESTVLHKGNYDFLQISEQLMGHETLVRLIRNKYSIQYSIEISL